MVTSIHEPFWAIGMSFFPSKERANEQQGRGKIDSQKSFFTKKNWDLHLTTNKLASSEPFSLLGEQRKEGVIGKTTDLQPEWIVLAGEEEVPPIGVVACRTSPRGHLVVACTKEGESGKVPWRESTKAESWKTKWNLGSWKKKSWKKRCLFQVPSAVRFRWFLQQVGCS